MKNILITGSNSYIGKSFKRWMEINDEFNYQVETISLKNDEWEHEDFSKYDTILHLAAIVHSPSTTACTYYKVNRDLTIEVAKKAKKQGVSHFIFFSTLSVYGLTSGKINRTTPINPVNDYGKSKFEAEKKISELESHDFKITIIRPPLVYGLNSPGNFSKLLQLFRWLPIFPKVENKRSMIFIETLSEFLYQVIRYQITGIFIPQNKEYVSILETYCNYKKIRKEVYFLIPLPTVSAIFKNNTIIEKVFGNLTVEKEMSDIAFDYQFMSFGDTLYRSIKEQDINGK